MDDDQIQDDDELTKEDDELDEAILDDTFGLEDGDGEPFDSDEEEDDDLIEDNYAEAA